LWQAETNEGCTGNLFGCIPQILPGSIFLKTDREVCISMKVVASLTDAGQAVAARNSGADVIECRLDLMREDPVPHVQQCREQVSLPIIATLRSAQEGGRYFGDTLQWYDKIKPTLPYVDYIDVEQRFALHAASIKSAGKTIIASHHSKGMLSLPELFGLERELRVYGDIPKIVVTPSNEDDVINLLSFTCAAQKPVCTGVMGSTFPWVRAMVPFFGSEFVYCHAGSATADGQYSVKEFIDLIHLLKNRK
jgi:3-dehydroquinate dehydratase-1